LHGGIETRCHGHSLRVLGGPQTGFTTALCFQPGEEKAQVRLSDVLCWEAVGLLKRIRGHDDRLLPRTLAFSEKPAAGSSQLVQGFRAITLTHPRERVCISHEVKHVQV